MKNELTGRYVASVTQPKERIHGYSTGWLPAIEWCREQFQHQNWCYISEGVFEFESQADHLLFMLRWS